MYWFSVKFQMDGNCLDNLATLTATLKFQFRLSFVSFINKLCHVSGGGPSFKFMATFWKLWKCDNSSFIQCFYVVNMKLFDQIWPSFKFMATVWKLWRRDNASFILFFGGVNMKLLDQFWPSFKYMATALELWQLRYSSFIQVHYFIIVFFYEYLSCFTIFWPSFKYLATALGLWQLLWQLENASFVHKVSRFVFLFC